MPGTVGDTVSTRQARRGALRWTAYPERPVRLADFIERKIDRGALVEPDLTRATRVARSAPAAVHPGAMLQFSATGELDGLWDAQRISQVVTNPLGNAVQHGTRGARISATAQGEVADVVLRVHSHGEPIPRADLAGLFSPFERFQSNRPVARDSRSLGLGLYIAERIVTAHRRTIADPAARETTRPRTRATPVRRACPWPRGRERTLPATPSAEDQRLLHQSERIRSLTAMLTSGRSWPMRPMKRASPSSRSTV